MFNIERQKLNKPEMKYLKFLIPLILTACVTGRIAENDIIEVVTNANGSGNKYLIEVVKGPEHNHPSMVIWTEDLEGNYIETLFITRYVGTGTFAHGALNAGKWSSQPGTARRPASLPYWAHQRGVKAPDGLYIPSSDAPMPDAVTSATPKGSYRLRTALSELQNGKFRILMEVNQPWDSNKYYTNSLYPGDSNYLTSLQPSIVYAVTVDPDNNEPLYLNPIGHGDPNGSSGKLYTDLTQITTAREIIYSISIQKINQ